MHFISRQFNIWYDITARSTNLKVLWCSGYEVCLTLRRSPVQTCTASRQVFDKMMFFYLIKNKIKHFISSQSNIWYEFAVGSTNLKVLWCSSLNDCVTRRRSPVQAWTASRKTFHNSMSLLDLKKSCTLYLVNSIFDMILLLRSTKPEVLWCSGYHVC